MDITTVITGLIIAAAIAWAVYKWKQPARAAEIERLAQSGVRLGADLRKEYGWSGAETRQWVKNWIFRSAQSYGYKIDVDECEQVARIAYNLIYGSEPK